MGAARRGLGEGDEARHNGVAVWALDHAITVLEAV
jgi:hypothetical protein